MVNKAEQVLTSEELNYFKKILEDRKTQILKNISGVYDELNQLGTCELNDEGDHVAATNHSRVDDIIIRQQQQELYQINTALSKIESGTYGSCEMCGVDIGTERLKVKPHAVYCIDCREIVERTEKKAC
ncbi:MAG: RNA polymerase-binding protein DksA [Campylobacterota bacterium]|nr:RNA polymerase-binding protein DksA [Campylobacterota bacterium]